jgi:hypothetical protein
MNTKFAYPCLKCSHSEVIDFANPHITECPKCKTKYPKFDLPVETTLPGKEKEAK